jgi:ABC-type uncharacterized transport system permease subunit
MLTGISTICFAASYAVAFGLEVVRTRRRSAWVRTGLVVAMAAGLLAHSLFLINRRSGISVLSTSTADWLLWAAWVLAIVYFAAIFYLPRTPTGLALLPIVLGLVIGSKFASSTPFATEQSFYLWGLFHGLALLLGTVTVSIGFLAGLMYLLQSYALKHSRSAANRLRLPSLEWLERVNSRTLGFSAVLIALGFASGLVMALATHRGDASYVLWSDPVVLSLAAMLVWLVVAEVFRLVYPAARGGRKVAYLTLASFVFLVIALASFTLLDTVHGAAPSGTSRVNSCNFGMRIADCGLVRFFNPKSEIRNPKSNI